MRLATIRSRSRSSSWLIVETSRASRPSFALFVLTIFPALRVGKPAPRSDVLCSVQADERPIERNQQKQYDEFDYRQQRAHIQKITGGEVSVRVADNQDARLIDEKFATP